MSERESLRDARCPECDYDAQPVESRTENGVLLGWTCQRCGWHPNVRPRNLWEPDVLPTADVGEIPS